MTSTTIMVTVTQMIVLDALLVLAVMAARQSTSSTVEQPLEQMCPVVGTIITACLAIGTAIYHTAREYTITNHSQLLLLQATREDLSHGFPGSNSMTKSLSGVTTGEAAAKPAMARTREARVIFILSVKDELEEYKMIYGNC
ncbi:predicted protein [Histoplasma capsulatum G186AR]|uniref:Uncharacterized protein n=1 Tax=Ajellomyces capsulatus (strain G186AR / H82 / ATCC MYA-2454 / RMSCC 2432) TaxID=447093 RepID=C0NXZ8_AJECG|nr:uncharacterized protein HCBG_07792 [Histoplasma capsulatum G186AR]EEH03666.1 predicted protein [Histoplasma capsulatum G186AR]